MSSPPIARRRSSQRGAPAGTARATSRWGKEVCAAAGTDTADSQALYAPVQSPRPPAPAGGGATAVKGEAKLAARMPLAILWSALGVLLLAALPYLLVTY